MDVFSMKPQNAPRHRYVFQKAYSATWRFPARSENKNPLNETQPKSAIKFSVYTGG